MISKQCKYCESYLKGECIGTCDDFCINLMNYANSCYHNIYGDYDDGCDYGDYTCEVYKED